MFFNVATRCRGFGSPAGRPLVHASDRHGNSVRHLFAEAAQCLLADDLRNDLSHRLIRQRILREKSRPIGQHFKNAVQQCIQICPLLG